MAGNKLSTKMIIAPPNLNYVSDPVLAYIKPVMVYRENLLHNLVDDTPASGTHTVKYHSGSGMFEFPATEPFRDPEIFNFANILDFERVFIVYKSL